MLIKRQLFGEVRSLRGDAGARDLLAAAGVLELECGHLCRIGTSTRPLTWRRHGGSWRAAERAQYLALAMPMPSSVVVFASEEVRRDRRPDQRGRVRSRAGAGTPGPARGRSARPVGDRGRRGSRPRRPGGMALATGSRESSRAERRRGRRDRAGHRTPGPRRDRRGRGDARDRRRLHGRYRHRRRPHRHRGAGRARLLRLARGSQRARQRARGRTGLDGPRPHARRAGCGGGAGRCRRACSAAGVRAGLAVRLGA